MALHAIPRPYLNSALTAMADVRSLLKNERASRRISHPQAVYTIAGTLSCSVCHVQLKSESLWDLHTSSAPHIKHLKKAQEGIANRTVASRKRKADSNDEEDLRKRPKPASQLLDNHVDQGNNEVELDVERIDLDEALVTLPTTVGRDEHEPKSKHIQSGANPGLPAGLFDPSVKGAPPSASTQPANLAIDEDEWAAFERDVATPPPEASAVAVLTAAATITAAPLTAAEIAAKSREEASVQAKEQREAELEGEKEDAARRLEEEFDDMEELEERVRRLREKREEIRRGKEAREATGNTHGKEGVVAVEKSGIRDTTGEIIEDEEEDEDDDEQGWDGWGIP